MFWIDSIVSVGLTWTYGIYFSGNDPTYSLNLLPSVYTLERLPFGMQSDVFLRGLTFNQTRIFYEGFPMYDPQTGHHNSNLPFTEMDILGFGVSLPYSSSFSGTPYIDITSGENTGGILRVGGRGYIKGSVRYNYDKTFLSFEGFRWDGYEFEYMGDTYGNPALSSAISFRKENGNYKLLGGYRYNSFGATGFYLPPTFPCFETTQVAFLGGRVGNLKSFVRWHQDQFNWGKGRNIHNTLLFGGEYKRELKFLVVSFGGVGEYIKSSIVQRATGSKDTMRITGFIHPYLSIIGDDAFLMAGVKFSYNTFLRNIYYEPTFILSKSVFSITAYYTLRYPDFTEMFYSDPKNTGNQNLKPEKLLGGEMGIETKRGIVKVYGMRIKDRIDWIKEGERYMAENISQFSVLGFEIFSPVYTFGFLKLASSFSVIKPYAEASGRYTLSYTKYRLSLMSNFISLRVENDTSYYEYFGKRVKTAIYFDINLNLLGFKGDYESLINCGVRNVFGVRPFITPYMKGMGRFYYCEYRHSLRASTTL